MSTIKISDLAGGAITLKTLLAFADANGIAFKSDVNKLNDFINTLAVLGLRGAILSTAIAPTEDGLYPCSESGTYTNFGGLVVDISNTLAFISVSSGQTVFNLVAIPISIVKDSTPVNGSINVVESGGIFDAIENTETDINTLKISNSICEFSDEEIYFPNSSWSVEMNIKFNDVTTTQSIIQPSLNGTPSALITAGNFNFAASAVATNIVFSINSGFLGNFKHILITYNGSVHKLYIDGVETSFSLNNTQPYTVGGLTSLNVGAYSQNTLPIDADFNLLRIWNKTLSLSEAENTYNGGKSYNKRFDKNDITFEILADNATSALWYDSSNFKNKGLFIGGSVESNSILVIEDNSITPINVLYYLDKIPDNIYIATDRELNIWYDSIIPYYDKQDYIIDSICSVGVDLPRCFRYTPITTSVNSLTFNILDLENNLIATKTVTLNAVSKSAGTGNKQLLFIGDSTTDSYLTDYLPGTGRTKYEMLHEISDLFIADGGVTPLFLGSRGDSPYKHQAHSGYSSDLFISNNPLYPNPFWDAPNSRNDFQKYMLDNSNFGGSNTIDYVFIQLGINDLKNGGNTSTVISRFTTLINTILDSTYGYPSAKIIISATPYAGINRSGWGLDFNASSSYVEFVENMDNLARKVVTTFHNNASFPSVYVSPNLLFTDRTFGFPRALQNVSARSTEQIYRYTDSVHPSESGYKQCADAYYSVFRSIV
tara:strand:- start:72 stop:2213 length:2142 start_codon:yes stop_codon:yes gene_type:complete